VATDDAFKNTIAMFLIVMDWAENEEIVFFKILGKTNWRELPDSFRYKFNNMFITIETPKGTYNTYAKIKQYGRYGKYTLWIASTYLLEGSYERCSRAIKEYASGHRKYKKQFLASIEARIHNDYKMSLPKVNFFEAEMRSYYAALGYNMYKYKYCNILKCYVNKSVY
jgi:hypothetical protein